MHGCDQPIEVAEIQAHLSRKHRELIFYEEFCYEHMTTGTNVVVLIKNNVPYLIRCFIYVEEVRLDVLCLNPCYKSVNDQYNIKLFRNSDNKLIFTENYPIIPFTETKHCPRCAFGMNKCHKGPSARSRVDQLPKIDDAAATELFMERYFKCQIQLFCSRNALEPDINNNTAFQNLLECYVCRNIITTSPFSCDNGHLVCENCKPKISICGLCRASVAEFPNVAAKRILRELTEMRARCGNKDCTFVDKYANFDVHSDYCRFG